MALWVHGYRNSRNYPEISKIDPVLQRSQTKKLSNLLFANTERLSVVGS